MADIISFNPATLEEIGRTNVTPTPKVMEYVAEARAAYSIWDRMGFAERGKRLLKAREYLLDHVDDFARTITLDNGKPLVEALTAEIFPVADLIHYFAHNAERLLKGSKVPIGVMGLLRRSSRISFRPIGVVGIISPWNYPFSIPAGETAMALICGNAVLLKPSSATALVGRKIEEMFSVAGLPPGVFRHLPGDAATGETLTTSSIGKLFFTGSVGAGRQVMAACARNLTPLVLELGGKDPMIVRADADMEQATSGAVWGAFTNCGQCCASVERVYVHESIFDRFVKMCVEKAARLKVGNGLEAGTDIGAMTTLDQLQKVEAHVEDAISRGAKIRCGGERIRDMRGHFFPPTIITGIDHSFACVRDETFGPLMPVMPFVDDMQAIRFANDTAYGLTASVWSRDIGTAERMAREIRAGTVMINDCVFTHALSQTPWGGCKASGFGRSHSRFGLQEMVEIRHVHTNRLRRKDIWWYGYDSPLYSNFAKLARHLTGGVFSQIRAVPSFARLWFKKKL
ncbi:MAG: aldehyde dehydrogenase family protein [Pseudomonadota bacterium]